MLNHISLCIKVQFLFTKCISFTHRHCDKLGILYTVLLIIHRNKSVYIRKWTGLLYQDTNCIAVAALKTKCAMKVPIHSSVARLSTKRAIALKYLCNSPFITFYKQMEQCLLPS